MSLIEPFNDFGTSLETFAFSMLLISKSLSLSSCRARRSTRASSRRLRSCRFSACSSSDVRVEYDGVGDGAGATSYSADLTRARSMSTYSQQVKRMNDCHVVVRATAAYKVLLLLEQHSAVVESSFQQGGLVVQLAHPLLAALELDLGGAQLTAQSFNLRAQEAALVLADSDGMKVTGSGVGRCVDLLLQNAIVLPQPATIAVSH